MEDQDNMNDSYYKNKEYEQENENFNINNEDEKKEENSFHQVTNVYHSNVYINKNTKEDNIIRKYLSEQMTKVNIINNNHNIDDNNNNNNNNNELYINQVTNIDDSDDDVPLLKTYGINHTINTKYEKNDNPFNNNNEEEEEKEKEKEKEHQPHQGNQINNDNNSNQEKHGIFLSKQESSKLHTKYANQDNQKETSSSDTSSDDDVCLLNLIKNDKNYNINNFNNQNYYEKKNNFKDDDNNNSSDYSSYDSDEPILIRSNLKNKINIQTNKLGNTSHYSNTCMNNNNRYQTNKTKLINKKTTLKSSENKKDNKFKNINAKTSLSKISCRKTSKNSNDISKRKKKTITKTRKKTKKQKKKQKKTKTKIKNKNKTNKHKDNKGNNHFNDNENDSICIGTFDPRNRSNKEKLVAQLLIRWWYVLPDWPPPDYDYKDELYNRKLKLVPLEEYEDKEDIDSQGFRKVYQISAFPGIFRDAMGIAYDLRDKDSCPCYNNLIKKTDQELLQLIYQAIKNQIQCLKNSVYNETFMEKNLEKELKEVELKLNKITKKNIIKI
ncbi:hypothetical protein PFHG_02761 [Plasmodium falciparum HB3]|uniref:Uncharacterized protein n=1 Tax=Plasmodium falciparum (isolate HB3) TaxID=137071 RepID=A0A0L7KCB9_PLAFX|nr:hypothetical protein PFHG_02761 [Plasmodium falciparum HB3]